MAGGARIVDPAGNGMTSEWRRRRETFRHGNVPEALVDAALKRLESEDATALNLRELARDVGVDHRAVYRHFPDKLALIAAVAEFGWREMGQRMAAEALGKRKGEETLVACGVGFFAFARDHPNLFHLMSGPRLNMAGRFPGLEETVFDALQILQRGFEDLGVDCRIARARAALFASALHGVSVQILYKRLRLAPKTARTEMAGICKMLIKGLR
jgi:AcrR family transcriptional regulator